MPSTSIFVDASHHLRKWLQRFLSQLRVTSGRSAKHYIPAEHSYMMADEIKLLRRYLARRAQCLTTT